MSWCKHNDTPVRTLRFFPPPGHVFRSPFAWHTDQVGLSQERQANFAHTAALSLPKTERWQTTQTWIAAVISNTHMELKWTGHEEAEIQGPCTPRLPTYSVQKGHEPCCQGLIQQEAQSKTSSYTRLYPKRQVRGTNDKAMPRLLEKMRQDVAAVQAICCHPVLRVQHGSKKVGLMLS